MLLLGDLNSYTFLSQLPECRLLQSFTSSFGLQDMHGGPTRITETTSSHLDVFLTNSVFSFTDVIALPVGFNDHHVVVGTYLTRRSHQPFGHKLINVFYSKLHSNLLLNIYNDEAWNDVFSFDDVSDTVVCFTAVLQGLMDLLIPLLIIRFVLNNMQPYGLLPPMLFLLNMQEIYFTVVLCVLEILWFGNNIAVLVINLTNY